MKGSTNFQFIPTKTTRPLSSQAKNIRFRSTASFSAETIGKVVDLIRPGHLPTSPRNFCSMVYVWKFPNDLQRLKSQTTRCGELSFYSFYFQPSKPLVLTWSSREFAVETKRTFATLNQYHSIIM